MADVDELKKLLGMRKEPEKKEEKKPEPKLTTPEESPPATGEEIDVEALSKIVQRMRAKYAPREEKKGEEIKRIIEAAPAVEIARGRPEELSLAPEKGVRTVGKVYRSLSPVINVFLKPFSKTMGESLGKDLVASGSRYTAEQWLALSLTSAFMVFIVMVLLAMGMIAGNVLSPALSVLLVIGAPVLVFFILLMIPGMKARSIAAQIEKDLPFALRHMSIEIRAGVGIYKSMESISKSDYGMLSQGFRNVLLQIEKGVPTEEALTKWAASTRSEALKRVVAHIVRAIRTGGNLSEVMITIADDVAFEKRMKIADFAEKLNLIGLFLMMGAIVMPVLIGILTAIGSSPSISSQVAMFSVFTPEMLSLFYFLIAPAFILMFLFFIKSTDPGT